MGYSYRTYIGPHVVCKVEIMDKPRFVPVCTNDQCVAFKRTDRTWDGRFCSYCGMQIGNIAVVEKEPAIDADDFSYDRLSERLVPPGGDARFNYVREHGIEIYMPNIDVPEIERDMHLESREPFGHMLIPADTINKEVISFIRFFFDDLALLRDAYGERNVEVKWGIIQDYM